MSFSDCLTVAAQHAFADDWDMPTSLWGNTVVSEANLLAGLDSDSAGTAHWD